MFFLKKILFQRHNVVGKCSMSHTTLGCVSFGTAQFLYIIVMNNVMNNERRKWRLCSSSYLLRDVLASDRTHHIRTSDKQKRRIFHHKLHTPTH